MEIALVLAFAAVAAGVTSRLRHGSDPIPVSVPTSPLDQAERILARRYAEGRISPEEYDRMTAVLRR